MTKIINIQTVDSPALVVFPDRVQRNIDRAMAMVGDIGRLRPHIKTHKSADVVRLMLLAGITQFKCATIAEAEMLGQCGAPDVVLAYQVIGPKLQRFIDLIKKYPQTHYACLTDNIGAAQEQAAAFEAVGLDMPVYMDLNLGMNRTGIMPDDRAVALFTFCQNLKGLHIVGLHAYDGHLRHPDLALRKTACDEIFETVWALKAKLEGGQDLKIIAGGSPTFPIHAQRAGVICSPGTFIYWDKGYGSICPEQPFEWAAYLVTRVISLPDDTKLCLDLGHKSVAAENSLDNRVYFPDAPELKPISQSEEHLVVEAELGHTYQVGDILYGVPYHICPTVALFERVLTVENDKVSGYWYNSARDRKLTV